MEQSILTGTKKVLGLDSTDTSFDYDVLTFINAAFSTLCDDLGVGPPVFVVEDESATWQDFISDDDAMTLTAVQSHTYRSSISTPYFLHNRRNSSWNVSR